MADGPKRVFNHDLLLNPGDAKLAREAFPAVADALDWERLRRAFTPHEQEANQSKRQFRLRGLQALAAALAALWIAALEPHLYGSWRGAAATWIVTGAVATLGTAGVTLGSSVLIGDRKERWLHHRAATKRMRQLHFQVLVRRATQLAAADPAVAGSALAERERALDLLVYDMKPGVARPVEAVIDDVGGTRCWLIGERPLSVDAVQPHALDALFCAYAQLRCIHPVSDAARSFRRRQRFPWFVRASSTATTRADVERDDPRCDGGRR